MGGSIFTSITGYGQSPDEPSRIGERKKGAYRYCYGVHLTKSVSLVYSTDYASHVVYILDIGDHKRLYGHDNRS